jgi:hypothetical protein
MSRVTIMAAVATTLLFLAFLTGAASDVEGASCPGQCVPHLADRSGDASVNPMTAVRNNRARTITTRLLADAALPHVLQVSDPVVSEPSEALKLLWDRMDHKPFDFALLCYTSVAENVKERARSHVKPEDFDTVFLLLGGHKAVLTSAFETCDAVIGAAKLFHDAKVLASAKKAAELAADVLDYSMLKHCNSDQCRRMASVALDPYGGGK